MSHFYTTWRYAFRKDKPPKLAHTETIQSFISAPNAYPQTGAQLFYFPDEKEGLGDVPSFKNPIVITDLGVIERWDVGGNRVSFSDDDFDFVYLQDDSIPPKDGVPEITWLSQNVQILEDYFAKPDGKRGT